MKLMKNSIESTQSRPSKSVASKRVKTGKTDGKKNLPKKDYQHQLEKNIARKDSGEQVPASKNGVMTMCGRVFDDVHFGDLQAFLADAGRH